MESIELLKTFGSAAGVAALITAGFNFWSLRVQHRRLFEAEDFKKTTGLEAFRYSKLYEALTEAQSWSPINYDLRDMHRVVTETTERYGKVKALLTRVSPLMESSAMVGLNPLLQEEEMLSRQILEHVYAGTEEAPLKPLLLKRQEIEQHFINSLSSSISDLTLRSSGLR